MISGVPPAPPPIPEPGCGKTDISWDNRPDLETSPTTSYWALGFLPPLVKLLELLLSNYKVLHEARPQ